jgi:hypothetical protein
LSKICGKRKAELIPRDIEEISEKDIKDLIRDGVPESLTLEYKEALNFQTDEEKKEFLADVASFANVSGGDIIYGLRAERNNHNKTTGRPSEIVGLNMENWDETLLSLDNIIINGIQPRIPGVRLRPIGCSSGKRLLVVRIPRSWIAPHMVTLGKSRRFYSRTSAGKYLMEASEIRSAYLRSIGVEDRIKRFRDERLSRIIAGETPVKLERGPKVIVHLFPLSSLDSSFQIDLSKFPNSKDPHLNYDVYTDFKPWGAGSSATWNYNFDGFLISWPYKENVRRSYVQLFRNGALEYVYCLDHDEKEKDLYDIFDYQKSFVDHLNSYLKGLKSLEVNPPIVMMLTMVGVKDYKIIPPQARFKNSKYPDIERRKVIPIDRDVMLLPEVIIEDYEYDINTIHHSVFDIIWNSVGEDVLPRFDEKGKFIAFE